MFTTGITRQPSTEMIKNHFLTIYLGDSHIMMTSTDGTRSQKLTSKDVVKPIDNLKSSTSRARGVIVHRYKIGPMSKLFVASN